MIQSLIESDPQRAKKSLGQHFLFDLNLTRKIAQQAGDLTGRTVIEIGPGPGGLTKALLETPLANLILIEKDSRFAAEWAVKADVEARLHVFEADALEVAEETVLKSMGLAQPALIIANLPYNVGTPLLLKWLKAEAWRGTMALMFQLEVAERICAGPGSAAYGRLSVIAQSRSSPKLVMKIPASAFTPPPKVESAVVRFDVLPKEQLFVDWRSLEMVTAAAFGQRRKMLRQSLKALCSSIELPVSELLTRANLDPTARPETISPKQFQVLASAFASAAAHIPAARSATPV
ncbi:MAG: 16S rRNA (adenine(1518)-N(6)/adenine(1519)-N(6))-dimethyltransferase RsmA [Caulobacterales bacterium]